MTDREEEAVVVVVGLTPRAGATTVARALAALAGRCAAGGAAIVVEAAPQRARGRGSARARRLARALGAASGQPAGASGRLCVSSGAPDPGGTVKAARALAPVVVDMGASAPRAALLEVAEAIVLVARPDAEPALLDAATVALARAGAAGPQVMLNRCAELPDAAPPGAVALPGTPAAARLALRGITPRGPLAAGLAPIAGRLAGSGAR